MSTRERTDGITMEHVTPSRREHWWRASRGGLRSAWFRDTAYKTGYQAAIDDLRVCEALERVPCAL